MEVYKGTATFSGIAIGKILYYYKDEYQIRQYLVQDVKKELADFKEASIAVGNHLKGLYEKNRVVNEGEARVFLKQAKLLEHGSFARAVESLIISEKINAAYAVMRNRDELSATFQNLEEPIIQEHILHVREVSDRILENLGGISPRIDLGESPVILVSKNLSPTELMEMEREKLLAVVTEQGSEVSHASIMAKTMELPTVIGVEVKEEWDGEKAIVDGYTGTIYLHPDEELLKEYEIRRQADIREREALLTLRFSKNITRDGREIGLYANIGNLDDLNNVLFYGADGIGLLRSEFQYLGRENYPREKELFHAYKKVAETMGERLAVIRTVDLGADKQAEYLDIPEEANPIMGNRGIRLCLDRKKMFKAQLRAIYRASAYGNLAIMYPMVTSEEEMDEIEQIVNEVKAGLREKDIPFKEIPTSIMIETPAAVMISRELAKRVDFLSLGTNDLTQYTLAMDRQNPLLKEKYRDHHPAVLRMIQMVVKAGHEEGGKVCICGELAADVELTETFLRMGVDALSVVPACILPVRKAIQEADLSLSGD